MYVEYIISNAYQVKKWTKKKFDFLLMVKKSMFSIRKFRKKNFFETLVPSMIERKNFLNFNFLYSQKLFS